MFETPQEADGTGRVIDVRAGEVIFVEAEPGSVMFIIQEGEIAIEKEARGEFRRLAVLGAGEFFGEMSILEGLPRSASARALTDCRLLRIDEEAFEAMLADKPHVAVEMLRKLSGRLREFDELFTRMVAGEEPPEDDVQVTGHFRHPETGKVYPLAGKVTTVGRSDVVTGHLPDIDLAEIDIRRSVSRIHAKILHRDGRTFVLEEIKSANGTFVDDEQVKTGFGVEIRHGSEVIFGTVRTFFRNP